MKKSFIAWVLAGVGMSLSQDSAWAERPEPQTLSFSQYNFGGELGFSNASHSAGVTPFASARYGLIYDNAFTAVDVEAGLGVGYGSAVIPIYGGIALGGDIPDSSFRLWVGGGGTYWVNASNGDGYNLPLGFEFRAGVEYIGDGFRKYGLRFSYVSWNVTETIPASGGATETVTYPYYGVAAYVGF